jgi:hypothetical protein
MAGREGGLIKTAQNSEIPHPKKVDIRLDKEEIDGEI